MLEEHSIELAELQEHQKLQDDRCERVSGGIRDGIKEVKTILERIEKRQLGNGGPGYNLRLDRLEQRQASKDKRFWYLYVPVGLALFAAGIRVSIQGIG